MAQRNQPLDISDIQDEFDIYDRFVIKQRKAKRKLASDSSHTSLLSEKVKRVDENRKRRPKVMELPEVSEIQLDDELPAIVESSDLREELCVEAIPNIQKLAADIISQYDQLQLEGIFSDAETNFMFRLFVSAVSFGQLHLLTFPPQVSNLYVSVLRDIASKQRAQHSINERFLSLNEASGHHKYVSALEARSLGSGAGLASHKISHTGNGRIIRTSEKFPVPKRILRCLDES